MNDHTHAQQLTVRHLLVPVALIAVTLTCLLGFQTRQIMRERDGLQQALGQQIKPFEDSQRLQAQLQALVVGTEKLAQAGNVGAKEIAAQLQKMGIMTANAQPSSPAAASPSPVPAAAEPPRTGPVKP